MDHHSYLRAKATQWLHHAWAGYRHDEWVGVLAGYQVVPVRRKTPPFWVTNYCGKQIHFSTLHLGPITLSAYAHRIRNAGLRFLFGYPSAISLLASYLVGQGDRIPLKGVFLSSEPIYAWQEQAVREAFDCPVFNYYSQSEKVVSAMTCGASSNLHISMENCIAEFTPATDSSSHMLLVGTCLNNFAMPLIRYALHDVSEEVSGTCPCGRAHRMMRPVETQEDAFIVRADGSWMSPALLYTPIHKLTGILESQIVQESLQHLTVRVVSDGSFGSDQRSMLRRDLSSLFRGEVTVSIEDVETIPRTANGKFRFVVSRCSRELAAGGPH
jgi:phenylacetate-CoA ligase